MGSLLFLISTLCGSVATAEPLSLEAFLSEAKKSSLTLLSAKYQAEAQQNRIRPASSLDDPFVAVGPDQMPLDGSGGGMLRFQISQTLPFPGKLGARREAAESRHQATESSRRTIERELTVFASQAFYRAYFNRRSLELNQNLSVLLTGALDSTKARYRTGGDASHHDWLLARIELSVLNVERLRLGREWTSSRALLNEIRNRPPDTEIELAKLDFSEDKETQAVADLSGQPELEAASANIIGAEADKRAARLSLFPDLVVQGMAMKPLNGMAMTTEKSNWGVMVGITIPLFFWRKQLDLISASESERLAAEAQRQALENRLKTEITDAKAQFTTASDVVSLYKKEVMPNTDMAVDNARSAYAAKRLPLPQFIETLRAKRTQDLELLAAQIDVKLAETRLKEVLSNPPLMRLAPIRPTLFGSGAMGGGMGASDTINMGKGMSGPTRKGAPNSSGTKAGGATSSGMEGM